MKLDFELKRYTNGFIDKILLIIKIVRLGNRKYLLHNLLNMIKTNGTLVCPNGFVLKLNKNNYKKIRQLFYFSVLNGVKFYKNKKGAWRYKNGILITPDNIAFGISSFDETIFSETFLYNIHFSDYNLIHYRLKRFQMVNKNGS